MGNDTSETNRANSLREQAEENFRAGQRRWSQQQANLQQQLNNAQHALEQQRNEVQQQKRYFSLERDSRVAAQKQLKEANKQLKQVNQPGYIVGKIMDGAQGGFIAVQRNYANETRRDFVEVNNLGKKNQQITAQSEIINNKTGYKAIKYHY